MQRTVGLVLLLATFFASTHSLGQVQFTPDHPQVEQAARRGIEFLQNNLPSQTGEAILAGLAQIEFGKRYDETNFEHPLVKNAISKADAALQGNPSLKDDPALYATSLAVILYCQVDDQKYKEEIQDLVDRIVQRQNQEGGFGYLGQPEISDTSQTQYAALAIWVAHAHGFPVVDEVGKKALDWLCQSRSDAGSWFYRSRNYAAFGSDREHRHSIHCSGLGTVYLLADFLRLTQNRARPGLVTTDSSLQLPPSVAIHIKPKNGERQAKPDEVKFNRDLLARTERAGNGWLKSNWTISTDKWNYYYLYALERYAFFREASEGKLKEFPTWYDEGVLHLFDAQDPTTGGWPTGAIDHETAEVNTSFAIMFLVRASQVLVERGNQGTVVGNYGFPSNQVLGFERGVMRGEIKIQGIQDVLLILKGNESSVNMASVLESMRSAISQLESQEYLSRNEQLSFLRGLIKDNDPLRRKIAIRLLANVQSINNAPALIYSLGDQNLGNCREAHNGLRLISRKFDSIKISDDPTRAEFDSLKKKWTDWYLTVNPDGQLID